MIGINWRDAKTNPPTYKDVDVDGDVIGLTLGRIAYYVSVGGLPGCVTHWCRPDEWKAHIESTLNPPDSPCCSSPKEDNRPENSESCSQWVFVSERWPTEEDGKHVLWMADSWSQPGVHPIYAFSQASHCHRHNLRWMRIPPCPPPPPPKRELPAVSPIYDGDNAELARYATLRNGTHVHVLELVGNAVYMVVRQHHGHQVIVNRDGHLLGDKSQHECDIVHVGGWLTNEELEARRIEGVRNQ